MTPRLFGLAEIDDETGEPDPARVRMWGMETEHGAVMHWREPGMSDSGGWATDAQKQFAVFESAASAEARFGTLFGLGLLLC